MPGLDLDKERALAGESWPGSGHELLQQLVSDDEGEVYFSGNTVK